MINWCKREAQKIITETSHNKHLRSTKEETIDGDGPRLDDWISNRLRLSSIHLVTIQTISSAIQI